MRGRGLLHPSGGFMWATVCPGRERPTLGRIGQGKKEHPSQFQSFTVDLPSADPPSVFP